MSVRKESTHLPSRYSGATRDPDYAALQQIHATLTTLARPGAHPATPGHPGHLAGLSEAEALYARVRRGRGRGALTPSDGGSDDMVTSSTPLVASYSTGSDDMATSMDTSILRDTSAEDTSLASSVVCGDRESRV